MHLRKARYPSTWQARSRELFPSDIPADLTPQLTGKPHCEPAMSRHPSESRL
jgi:hypothetical protein